MPHTSGKRYAVVSCHVERPLDDAVWRRFAMLHERRPGGFRIAALMRPPDAGEDRQRWLKRARAAAAHGPFGHHTHWTSPTHARPTSGGAAERVRDEAAWLRDQGLRPRFFCGGGWYIDESVAEALAELAYVDCTATAFRPAHLADGAGRLAVTAPTWIVLATGRLLELPATHSLGMAARAAAGRLSTDVVHVYFHDTDLLDTRRRLALRAALELLGRRRTPSDLERLAAAVGADAPEVPFSRAFEL